MAGLWFEEFTDGMVFNHEWSRTITETDNVWFSLLTMNVQPLHIDAHYAAKTEWGKPLVNSLFTLGLMIGMSVNDTTFVFRSRCFRGIPSRCAPRSVRSAPASRARTRAS